MPKKKFGQNFLINESISKIIVNLSNLKQKNVLEIGPGNLALTKNIIKENPKKFIALEIDKDLIKKYKNTPFSKHLIDVDALTFNELEIFKKKSFYIISNLPFNLSSKLLIKWLKIQNYFNCIDGMTLMFQKELAERIIAKENSKKYGRLTILSNAFFSIEKKLDVKKDNFFPSPKIDTSVLKFTPLLKNKIKKQNLKNIEYITSFFFNERRKKNKKKIQKIFNSDKIKNYNLDIYYSLRPENITKEIFYKMSEML